MGAGNVPAPYRPQPRPAPRGLFRGSPRVPRRGCRPCCRPCAGAPGSALIAPLRKEHRWLAAATSRRAWPLERPHRKKAIWGWLAFVVRLRVGDQARHDADLRRRSVHGRVPPGRGGARPRRPAAGRGGRVHPERRPHHQGPGLPGGRHGHDGPAGEDPLRRERDVAADRRQRGLGRRARRARGLRGPRRLDRGQAAGRARRSRRSPPSRPTIPASTSRSSAAPAPPRPSTRRSPTTSRRRASSRSRSR